MPGVRSIQVMNIRSKIFSLLFLLIPAYGGKVDNQTIEHVYINPAYRTTIVAGSAGSKEKLSSGKGPEKTLAKYIEDYGLVLSCSFFED